MKAASGSKLDLIADAGRHGANPRSAVRPPAFGVNSERLDIETAFDQLAQLAAVCCDMPVALVSLVDSHRRFFQTDSHCMVSLCAKATLQRDQLLVVPDARKDDRFKHHPMVTANPGIVFYAAAPMVSSMGEAIGALCIADYRSRELSFTQVQLLQGLAAQAVAQFELRRNLLALEATVTTQLRYVDELHRQQQRLEQENATDPLTGLGNRRAFERRLDLELSRAGQTGNPLALMILDVDFFKHYNDSYGHLAGDEVLRRLAAVMARVGRDNDFIARVGGEEFALILPDTRAAAAFEIAQMLCRAVSQEHWPHREVTVSVGVATAVVGADSGPDLAQRADSALYCSKRDGRNRVTMTDAAHAD